MDSKQCTKCSEAKPRSEFSKHSKNPDGLNCRCRECTREDTRARCANRTAEQREKKNATDRARRANRTEEQREERKAHVRARRANRTEEQREEERARGRACAYRREYGITLQQYDDILAAQNGCCGMCGQLPGRRRLDVDHDEKTGEIRGLLCNRCNYGLGCFDHDPALFEAGAVWIRTAKTGMFVPDVLQARRARKPTRRRSR